MHMHVHTHIQLMTNGLDLVDISHRNVLVINSYLLITTRVNILRVLPALCPQCVEHTPALLLPIIYQLLQSAVAPGRFRVHLRLFF